MYELHPNTMFTEFISITRSVVHHFNYLMFGFKKGLLKKVFFIEVAISYLRMIFKSTSGFEIHRSK